MYAIKIKRQRVLENMGFRNIIHFLLETAIADYQNKGSVSLNREAYNFAELCLKEHWEMICYIRLLSS
jgi:hypothetical protein